MEKKYKNGYIGLMNENADEIEELKTAVVAIVGRPSSGKSTFLNTACQEPVSIVSPVPQTTRNAIKGIVNTSYGQLIFIDTPGYHDSGKKLNLRLKTVTENQLDGTDCVLYIIDATRIPGEEERNVAALVLPYSQKTVVAVNKTDDSGADAARAIGFIHDSLPEIPDGRIIGISALNDEGINDVLLALYSLSPVAPPMYPEELATDQNLSFRIAEIIRGEAINRLSDEIPHALYVDVADAEKRNDGKKLWVRAFLCVERESQKGIVIGKGASKIKEIRTAAQNQLNKVFTYKVELDLQVKVDKNWRQHDYTLNRLVPR